MAKKIKVDESLLEEIVADFRKKITESKFDGKFSYSKDFGRVDRKATVMFSQDAYIKMMALVQGFSDEVAWHGVAYRDPDETKDLYCVTDILVYPQEVTGATVTTDQEKYEQWLYSHDDDVFNNIRMQGHSHVNMGVIPSGVDDDLYSSILGQIEDDMFYIFMILNKRNDMFVKIYDMKKNILFESADVNIGIVGIDGFLENAKKMVQERKFVPSKPAQSYNSYLKGTKSRKKKVTNASNSIWDDFDYDDWDGYGYYDKYGRWINQ